MASLEWLFRGDLKDSHYSFEIDLSLCIWPPASTVQRIVVPLRIGTDRVSQQGSQRNKNVFQQNKKQ